MASVTMPFYCKLCHIFFNEPKDAELHILGVEHNENYQNYVTKNPDYESDRKAKSRRGGENRKTKAEAQRSLDSDTKKKRKSVDSKGCDEKRLKLAEKKVDEVANTGSTKTDVLPDASDSSLSVYSVISSDESDGNLPLEGVTLVTIDEAPVDVDGAITVEANSALAAAAAAANLDRDESTDKHESDKLSSSQGDLFTEKIVLDCGSDFLVGWVISDDKQDSVANSQESKTDDSNAACTTGVLMSAVSSSVCSDVSNSIINTDVGVQGEAEMEPTEQRSVHVSDEASSEGVVMGVVVSIEESRRESDATKFMDFNALSNGMTTLVTSRDQNLGSNEEVENDTIHVLHDDDCFITNSTVSEIKNCDAKLLHFASDQTRHHLFIGSSDMITSAAISEVVSSSSALELTSESDVGSLVSASSVTAVAIEKSEAEVIETSEAGASNRRDVADCLSENRIAPSRGIMTDSSSVTVVCEAVQDSDPSDVSETLLGKAGCESPDDASFRRNESNKRHVLGIVVVTENSRYSSHDDVSLLSAVNPTTFDEILPQVNTSASETLPLVQPSDDINRGPPETVGQSRSLVAGGPLTFFSRPEVHVSAVATGNNASFSQDSAEETRPAELTHHHSSSGKQMSPVDCQFVSTTSCQDAVTFLSAQETSGEGDRPSEAADDERLLNDDDNLEVEML